MQQIMLNNVNFLNQVIEECNKISYQYVLLPRISVSIGTKFKTCLSNGDITSHRLVQLYSARVIQLVLELTNDLSNNCNN